MGRKLILAGTWLLFAASLFVLPDTATSQQPVPADETPAPPLPTQSAEPATIEPMTHWNLPTWTMGGKQFWTDYRHFHGYRIQKNAVTGHHRLLSPSNTRLAWGNLQGCQQRLGEIAEDKDLQPVRGHVVIVLHGLTRARSSMQSLSKYLAEHTDAHVINVSYASGRDGIEGHTAALASVIEHLPEAQSIDFVGHSMGNIIVRYYLGTRGHDPRFRRMVMLAPPNHGSQLATWLKKNLLFKTVTGSAGQQMGATWEEIHDSLATPEFEFAIIAGAPGQRGGLSNPLIKGDNDLIVSVNETRLAGASDFWQGELWHGTMMYNRDVQQAVTRFLNDGYLIDADKKQPVTSDLATVPRETRNR